MQCQSVTKSPWSKFDQGTEVDYCRPLGDFAWYPGCISYIGNRGTLTSGWQMVAEWTCSWLLAKDWTTYHWTNQFVYFKCDFIFTRRMFMTLPSHYSFVFSKYPLPSALPHTPVWIAVKHFTMCFYPVLLHLILDGQHPYSVPPAYSVVDDKTQV